MIFKTITNEFTGVIKSIGLFGKSLADLKNTVSSIKSNGIINTFLNTSTINTEVIHKYNAAIMQATSSGATLAEKQQIMKTAMEGTNRSTAQLIGTTNGATVSMDALVAAQNASTLAARLQSKALKAVSIVANMLTFAAIAKGIQIATKAIDQFVNRTKYAIETAEKSQQSINEAQTKLKNISNTIEENKDRFLELSEGVNKFSKNIKLSEEDYAEYLSISNQLAEISPNLVSGYTDQGNALLHIGDNAEETNKMLNEILETEKALAEQTLIDNIDNVAKGIYYQVEESSNKIADLQSQLSEFSNIEENLSAKDFMKKAIGEVDENTKKISLGVETGLDVEDIEKLKNAIKNSGAHMIDNSDFDNIEFFAGDYKLIQNAIEEFYAQIDYTKKNESAAYINGLKNDIQNQENTIKNTYSKINSNLTAWVKSTYEYNFLNEKQKNLIDALIPNLDWQSIKDETGKKFITAGEYEQFIRETIITPLMGIPDKYQATINQKFAQLLEFETGDINIVDFASELEQYLNNLGITINLTPLLGDTAEIKENYDQITNDAARKFIEKDTKNYALLDTERKALDDFAKENSINTKDEIAFWNKCLEESNTREQAMEKYLNNSDIVNEKPSSSSITETIEQLNTQLKPTFDSLKSAYQDIFTTDDDGNPLFTLENVDLSMLDNIKSTLDALNENEELGITIDYSSFEDLARILTDTASTEIDVKNGFNDFITDIVFGTDALDNLNASDAKLVETLLQSLGVTNAHEIVYDSLIAKTEVLALEEQLLAEVGGDLANATSNKVLAFLEQAGASETTRAYLIKLIAEEQVFSNQDLDVSGKISKLQELAQAYGQTALAAKIAAQQKANEQSHTIGSWSETDLQNFQKEWNDGLSSISIDFTPKTDTSKSKSKSKGSDKKETDKWLEEYKKKLAELQNMLDKGKYKCPLL